MSFVKWYGLRVAIGFDVMLFITAFVQDVCRRRELRDEAGATLGLPFVALVVLELFAPWRGCVVIAAATCAAYVHAARTGGTSTRVLRQTKPCSNG